MKLTLILILGGLMGITAPASRAAEDLKGTRQSVKEWVETRQMISEIRSEWAEQRETLQASIALFQGELQSLDQALADIDTGNSEIDRQEKEQAALKQDLTAAEEMAGKTLGELEALTRALLKRFPPPLADKVAPAAKLIPEDSSNTKASLTLRVQALVQILNAAEKFNTEVTLASEIRQTADGKEKLVETLYLGLAQALFMDQEAEGGFAGLGTPGSEGWNWTPKPDQARIIRNIFAMYRNEQPAAFVKMPLKVQ